MVSVEEAESIIQAAARDYGRTALPLRDALGRTLAEDILADRDLPPYNRVTMDGIAIAFQAYAAGARSFRIKAVQAAGDEPIDITDTSECIEIMTGAALPALTDTVIRYEDLEITNGLAKINAEKVNPGQNIHRKASDKKQHDIVAGAHRRISPAVLNVAAAVGKDQLLVRNLPKVAIISSGDELVDVSDIPSPYQVRRSNNYAMWAALEQYGLHADMHHFPDDPGQIREQLQQCLEEYDVILLSGGISMGKFDHIPAMLEALSVQRSFHKVRQRPGKPFWFGRHANGAIVFAFPGNPVSTFMCLHRYFLPWLETSSGAGAVTKIFAVLAEEVVFEPELQYFLQVRLEYNGNGQLLAHPVTGNGSGDFSNLLDTDAFIELPAGSKRFAKGEVFRIWPFK